MTSARITRMALGVLAAALSLSIALGHASAVDVSPESPGQHQLVKIRVTDGELYLIIGIKDGQLVDVDTDTLLDGRTVFTGRPGKYVIAGREGDARFQKTIEIGGGGSDPDTPPDDPTPPPQFGLEKFAHEHAISDVEASARTHCAALATNFDAVASKALAGGFRDRSDLVAMTDAIASLNRGTLGQDIGKWRVWLTKIGFAMDRYEDDGKIVDVTKKAYAFREIAAGLRKAAASNLQRQVTERVNAAASARSGNGAPRQRSAGDPSPKDTRVTRPAVVMPARRAVNTSPVIEYYGPAVSQSWPYVEYRVGPFSSSPMFSGGFSGGS